MQPRCAAAAAAVTLHRVGVVVEDTRDLVDACGGDGVEHVVDERSVGDLDQRLRRRDACRAQPLTESGGDEARLHRDALPASPADRCERRLELVQRRDDEIDDRVAGRGPPRRRHAATPSADRVRARAHVALVGIADVQCSARLGTEAGQGVLEDAAIGLRAADVGRIRDGAEQGQDLRVGEDAAHVAVKFDTTPSR